MDDLSRHLLALEERLLDSGVRKDAEALNALLAEEFREFGSSGGTFTKREIVDALAAEVPRKTKLTDFALKVLAPDIALVTYRSHSERGEALRCSLWVDRSEGWRMVFHQGTRVIAAQDVEAVS